MVRATQRGGAEGGMAGQLRIEVADRIATLTLDDPATLNALGLPLAEALHEAVRGVCSGALDCRAVVLTGAGRGFCSGADLSASPARSGDAPSDMGAGLERVYNPLMTALRDLPVPLVTAVNGAAAGIGCSLALMGDLIVAAEEAYFLQAFRRIGLVPDGGASFMLPRLIGRARAMEMTLLGERVPAATALAWGLVNRVTPADGLAEAAADYARRLADGPASLGLTRRLVWRGETAGWEEQLRAEREAQAEAGRTADFVEGVRAFAEKRPARFQGR